MTLALVYPSYNFRGFFIIISCILSGSYALVFQTQFIHKPFEFHLRCTTSPPLSVNNLFKARLSSTVATITSLMTPFGVNAISNSVTNNEKLQKGEYLLLPPPPPPIKCDIIF